MYLSRGFGNKGAIISLSVEFKEELGAELMISIGSLIIPRASLLLQLS